MAPLRFLLSIFLLVSSSMAFGQQDVDLYVTSHLLTGTKILKVYQSEGSVNLFALAPNNKIYQINTTTNIATDISNLFAAYSKFQFIDIASPADNELFIGTNSPNVIFYNNGVFSIIGTAQGLQGNVTSVGYLPAKGAVSSDNPNTLYIGTESGIAFYLPATGEFAFDPLSYTGYVYSTNYRVGIFTNNELLVDPRFFGVAIKSNPGSTEGGYLWDSSQYGTVNTGFNDFPTLALSYQIQANLINLYWGTNNGLYQVPMEESEYSNNIVQYLNGIQVNKINNVYGLTSFGNQYFKSNILAGTNQGLYFSNSTISPDQTLVPLNFTHLDALGNVNINDIQTSINGVVPSPGLFADCENQVWLATDDGVYCIQPDYAKYFNPTNVDALNFYNLPDTTDVAQICTGDSVTATIDYDFTIGNSIQWFKNGSAVTGQTSQNFVLKSSGDYYAVLYDPCENLHEETNHLQVNVNAPVFSFNYPDTLKSCGDSTIILSTNGSSAYSYQWFRNDTLTTNTSPSFTVQQPGKYKVAVSSCPGTWVSSQQVQVEIITLPLPVISADKPLYCAEDTGILTINTPTDPSYTVNWYQNGSLLPFAKNQTVLKVTSAGNYNATITSNSSTCLQTSTVLPVTFTAPPKFTFNYPAKLQYCAGEPIILSVVGSDTYQYQWYRNDTLLNNITQQLTVNESGSYMVKVSSCPGSWVSSDSVQISFVTFGILAINTDKADYCIGDNATLTVNLLPSPLYTINWFKDNQLITASTNQGSITTNIPGNYSVSVFENMPNSDGSVCSSAPALRSVIFNAIPTVSIKEKVTTALCAGQTIFLQAEYTAGTVKWSTGETTDQIAVTQSGNYSVVVTSSAGCQSDTSITINLLADPVLNISDTSLCTNKKQIITLTAPPGYTSYSWNNDLSIAQTYQVASPQTVKLTVTDANGCQATQQIKVTEACAEINITNAFTPNDDGINDTWVIQGLDATATVKVFSRWGRQLYQSLGYNTPWNGEYGGKRLPAGVYYYVITAKSNTQRFSGSLTIIY